MRPIDGVPFRAIHRTRGSGTVTRTESAGIGKTRRPVMRFDKSPEARARVVSWADIEITGEETGGEPAGIRVDGDTAYITEPPTKRLELGDLEDLIRERGLDPADWVVVTTTLNEWDAMAAVKRGSEPRTVRLRQWKVVLRRAPHLILVTAATHVPVVKRGPGPPISEKPDLIVIEGDHQVPFHDVDLHLASLSMLAELSERHRLVEHHFHGDTGDYPTISRHADHPAAAAPVNDCVQGVYDLLRAKREHAPGARSKILKGNHDWRIEAELLLRAERLYGIKPATTPEHGEELSALSLRRLLHLDALQIELVEDHRGWEHAEIEVVPGPLGLVVRHGWLTGQNTAEKSLKARGKSLIVGHKHTREHVFQWDAAARVERQAVVAGVMCRRDGRFPHYAPCDNWSQGLVLVTRWPDLRFEIEHARWDGETLSWRDYRWRA